MLRLPLLYALLVLIEASLITLYYRSRPGTSPSPDTDTAAPGSDLEARTREVA